jgi:hypothetical protein
VWLLHYQVAGNALPEYDEIDQDGEFLDMAAADIQDALMQGGHAAGAGSDSSTYPVAYSRLRGALAERCALYFAEALGGFDPDVFQSKWDRNNEKLDAFRSGRRVGELTVTDSRVQGQFEHGTMTSTTLDTYRFRISDEL